MRNKGIWIAALIGSMVRIRAAIVGGETWREGGGVETIEPPAEISPSREADRETGEPS